MRHVLSLLLLILPMATHSFASSSSSSGAPKSNTATNSNVNDNNTNKPVQSVVVVGGTHGNEYTGVWCIKELEQPSVFQRFSARFPSLSLSTLLGNPDAHLANKRFIDTDLNREFTTKKLQAVAEQLAFRDGNPEGLASESLRAHQVNQLLGPKTDPVTDVVVDMHTTTTNMGVTLIIPERDALMAQAAAYVLRKCRDHPVPSLSHDGPTKVCEETRIVMHSIPNRHDRPNLSSVGKHGFTIEVGPVPQGVIRHDGVEKTKQALEAFLEFLELHNNNHNKKPVDVLQQIKEWYPTGRVPCYRSAVAKKPGEMSGKIRWPCADHNPNFPAYMIHKSIQDQDFKLLKTGDPLFVSLEGDVIPYDGSHGDVYLMFINEGGYYYASSGTGIGVAVATEYDLETADFVDVEDLCLAGEDSDDCSLE